MPRWLPVYPGAIFAPKGKISSFLDPTAQFLTRDPVRQRWYATYRARRFARLLGFELAHVPAGGCRPTTLGIVRQSAVVFLPPVA